jgi:uncharacterized protein
MDASPFNPDELTAQSLGGGGPHGGGGILDHMSDQTRLFLARLPYVFAGVVDAGGWPIATLLTGAPGFVYAPDPATLQISAVPAAGDPAAGAFAPGCDIGILGIDLSVRRRVRANGRVAKVDPAGIEIAVTQSFANCPQYIQRRAITHTGTAAASDATSTGASSVAESMTRLDEAARSAITAADTLFVASHSRAGQGAAFGSDISHRGGRPGFVRVDRDDHGDVLTIPDFRGNRYFNTLGNLIAEPRASLLFVDFDSGDLLQLQGEAQVDWNNAAHLFDGAVRLWRFRMVRGWRRRAASPLHWRFVDYSPTTLPTGSWGLMPGGPDSRSRGLTHEAEV